MKIIKFDEEIRLEYGSSTHHPETELTGITTCDFRLWIKFRNKWIKPCYNDYNSIFELINDSNTLKELEQIIYKITKYESRSI